MSSAHEATGLLQSVVISLQDRLRRPDLYFGFNEAQLTAIIPVSSYWLTATFYEFLEYFDILAQYRLQPTEEERRRNVPSRAHVIKTVLTLHAYQLLLGFAVDWLEIGEAGDETAARWAKRILSYYPPHHPSIESWHASILLQRIIPIVIYGAFLLGRQILALAVIDTWVFWFHYTAHKVQWIYREHISYPLLPRLPLLKLTSRKFKVTFTRSTTSYTPPTHMAPYTTASLKASFRTSCRVSWHRRLSA